MDTATAEPPSSFALTRAEAAALLRVKPATLAKWATRGTGPVYSRSGQRRGRVFYRHADLERWLAARRIDPRGTTTDG